MNKRGIHLRPASLIFNAINHYPGTVKVAKADEVPCVIDTQFALLGLCLLPYTMVTIQVDGPNEASFCDKLAELFSKHYDFA